MVQDENKEELQAGLVQNCTCFNLRKASRAVTHLFDEGLKSRGLNATQFTLLAAISSSDNVAITQLSRILIMDRTTLTRNLSPLQKKNWVLVRPGEDKRTRVLSLTSLGKKVLKSSMEDWRKLQTGVVKTLGRENWETLLDKIDFAVKKLNPY